MKAASREEFFADPDVTAALNAYAETCLDLVEQEKQAEGFPDPAEFLRQRGVDLLPDGPLEVHEKTFPIGVKPEQRTCPDGSWGCTYVCREIRDEQVCRYICRC